MNASMPSRQFRSRGVNDGADMVRGDSQKIDAGAGGAGVFMQGE